MTKQFQPLTKLSTGDQVGVVSPSAGLPGLFPWVQDLGLQRLRDVFGLRPVEYPTTRVMGAAPADRARDVMAAFADPANRAVFASIGGHDQIKIIKHLDPQVFLDNPKPFFGFSDNTNLHNFLWNLGLPSYYGASVMNQFGMSVAMFDLTVEFIRHALFDSGEFEITAASQYSDEDLDWADKSNLQKPRRMEPNGGLVWDGAKDASGILWGGCVESLIMQASAGKYLPADQDLDGTILALETAEDIPEHWLIECLLTGFGERGWLERCQAVLVGRPKTWAMDKPFNARQKAAYRQAQQETVIKTVRQYNPNIPIVQNLDFGHTEPQIPLPLGRPARVITNQRKVYLTY
jgi:muramoyltetrapeptide carboxypeptidase LdcA involved in peptidoglycan recycling